MPKPIVHTEVWEQVCDELRSLIISGQLGPGERLVETDLSARFNVSRGPVRSALKELERTGLVVVSPRRGSHVASFSQRDIDELYDVTLVLESAAVRDATEHATPEEIAALRNLNSHLEAAEVAANHEESVTADLELHRQVMLLSGNQRLLQLWDQLSDQMRLVISISQRSLAGVIWAQRNEAIENAIETRDGDLAEREVATYFGDAADALRGQFDQIPDPEEATANQTDR